MAGPSAHVTDDAFERISTRIADLARQAGTIDAVYLDLHGAMVTESFEDGEGQLLARVRAAIGPDTPLIASLDLHANVTEAMVRHADALVGFCTYPHVDMAETGAGTAHLLKRILEHGKPAKAMRSTDFLVPINWQCTLVDPAKAVYAELAALESADPSLSLSFLQGFPPADIAECGPSVIAYGRDQTAADNAADALMAAITSRQDQFDGDYLDPEAATAAAMQLAAANLGKPIVIADTQDNPGGGGDGDTTGMLRAFVAAKADAVLGLMIDADAAAAAHKAGIGGTVELSLGGRSWHEDTPFPIRATVEQLGDGQFTCTGGFYMGSNMQLGQMALIRITGTPTRVVIASKKVQAADQEMFRHLGVEPADERILVLKSSVHFRADFEPIAADVLVARAPGPVIADPADLPYTRLRPGVCLGPKGPVYGGGGPSKP
jgi:microcystin degradation protein MlrC